MAKRKRKSDEKSTESTDAWDALPKKDKRFIWAMTVIDRIINDPKLCYRPLPSRWNRALGQVGRDTLVSLVTECVSRLIDSSVLPRIKKSHRQAVRKKKRAKRTR